MNISFALMALIATCFTWFITALGSSLVFFAKKINQFFLDGTLGFAAGVMIAASFFSLILPAMDMATNLHYAVWLVVTSGFIFGGLSLFIFDKIIKHYLFKNNISPKHRRSLLLFISITFHNIPEGLAIGVAFGSLALHYSEAALASAIALAIGIALQNFPEGSAVSLPLYREKMSRLKAFMYGQASALVEPIAGFLGALLVLKVQVLLPFLLAFAAGAMIYVVIVELIPESQNNDRKDLMALFSIIGFSIMMILDIALG